MNDFKKRHRAREIALQVLFQKEFVKELKIPASLMYFRTQLEASEESWTYASVLLHGVEKHHAEIDSLISEKSKNWKIARMAPVDLSALRIAIFEMCFYQEEVIPHKVVIDEAIELVKRFGSTDSTKFVNGLLDEVYRSKSKED